MRTLEHGPRLAGQGLPLPIQGFEVGPNLAERTARFMQYLISPVGVVRQAVGELAGAVVPRTDPRTDLLEKLWDRNADVDSNVVDVHLSRLRSKLEEVDTQTELVTVRGVGIKLVSEGKAEA